MLFGRHFSRIMRSVRWPSDISVLRKVFWVEVAAPGPEQQLARGVAISLRPLPHRKPNKNDPSSVLQQRTDALRLSHHS
jgi:hypothetical protein